MTAVDIVLKPSAKAHSVLFWLHMLPLALVPFSMEPGPVMLLLGVLIAGSWAALRRHPAFGFGERAISRVLAAPDGDGWQVGNPAGSLFPAELEDSSSLFAGLVILNFRVGKSRQRRSRVLLGDEAEQESLRKLRVRLAERRTESEKPRDAG